MKLGRLRPSSFTLKVALAALKADKTVSELCQEFAIASSQIYAWKNQLEERGIEAFADKRKAAKRGIDIEKLHAIIGKLVVERELITQTLER